MKILLVESSLSSGQNFATHSLFRGIFFEILEFRFHRHSLTVTKPNQAVNRKANSKAKLSIT